ncbi:MAG TPA: chemotaxis protein CheW [Bacteroidales bacterium]
MDTFKPLQLKHYLIFKVADEKFAIDILDIESVHTSIQKPVFEDLDDLRTAVKIYKKLVPVINLRNELRLRGSLPVQPSLVFLKNKDTVNPIIGVQVDEIVEITEAMVPKKLNGKSTRLVKAISGLAQEIIMVLRIKDILSNDKLINVAASPILN